MQEDKEENKEIRLHNDDKDPVKNLAKDGTENGDLRKGVNQISNGNPMTVLLTCNVTGTDRRDLVVIQDSDSQISDVNIEGKSGIWQIKDKVRECFILQARNLKAVDSRPLFSVSPIRQGLEKIGNKIT